MVSKSKLVFRATNLMYNKNLGGSPTDIDSSLYATALNLYLLVQELESI